MTGKIAAKVVGQIAKSLIISGVILALCIIVMQVNQSLGIILMMLYSSFMVIKSSRKEMPLNKFTALLPGVMSIITFLIMLGLIGPYDPAMPIIGMGIGVVVGFLLARSHKVYEKNGVVYAKRTFFYILIWALSMLFTQGSALAGMREITGFGFLLNGFSSAMMIVLSVFLFLKASGRKGLHGSRIGNVAAIFFLSTLLPFSTFYVKPAKAIDFSKDATAKQIGNHVFSDFPRPPSAGCVTNWGKASCHAKIFPSGIPSQSTGRIYYWTDCGDTVYVKLYLTSDKEGQEVIRKNFNKVTSEGNIPYTKSSYKGGMLYFFEYSAESKLYSKNDNMEIGYLFEYKELLLYILYGNGGRNQLKPKEQPCEENTKKYFKLVADHCINRLAGITRGSATPSPPSSPTPTLNPNLPPFSPGSTPQPNPYPRSDFEFSDDEAAAGGLIALLMLLTGVGLNAAASAVKSGAMAAVQEAANTAAMAGQAAAVSSEPGDHDNWGYDANTHSNGTLMLDGDEAKDWINDPKNGFYDKEGNPTTKFDDFMTSMPSERGTGLQGYAGDIDKDGNPTGDYVIIVPDETPREDSQTGGVSDTDEQTETTNDDDQEHSTDDSSPDTDDEATTKTEPSGTTPAGDSGDDDDKKPGIDTNKPQPPTEQTPPIEYPNAKQDLDKMMGEISKEKTDEGYFVRNPHRFDELKDALPLGHPLRDWANTLQWGEKGINNIGELLGGVHPIDWVFGWKGGQCGDYAEEGVGWSRKKLNELYGRDVKFDKIIIKSNVFGGSNHAATRVTLPNGDKYILDYWERLQKKKTSVYTEKEWIKKNHKEFNIADQGITVEYEKSYTESSYQKDAGLLKKYIEKQGEKKGKELFINKISQIDSKNLGRAKDLVSQWNKKPW